MPNRPEKRVNTPVCWLPCGVCGDPTPTDKGTPRRFRRHPANLDAKPCSGSFQRAYDRAARQEVIDRLERHGFGPVSSAQADHTEPGPHCRIHPTESAGVVIASVYEDVTVTDPGSNA